MPLGQARDKLRQRLTQDLLGPERRMALEPVVPTRDAEVRVGREDAVRRQMVRPHQQGGIQLLTAIGLKGLHVHLESCRVSQWSSSLRSRENEVIPSTITR